MKRERRKRYPKDWEKLARQCKEKVGWKCEFCHVKENARRKSKRTGTWYRVHLHAAHRDHDVDNLAPPLLCLCAKCHGRYDYQYQLSLKETDAERLKHRILLSARKYKSTATKLAWADYHCLPRLSILLNLCKNTPPDYPGFDLRALCPLGDIFPYPLFKGAEY